MTSEGIREKDFIKNKEEANRRGN